MFRHLLVPLDLVSNHSRLLELVSELATLHRADLTLLHVIEPIEGLADEETRAFLRRLEAKARDHLKLCRDRLGDVADQTETLVTYGKRAPEVVAQASRAGVDLIVMTSRPMDRDLAERGWPTISQQVALMAPVPVLLFR